ncbi:MAG: GNAT family N-acetyltransferase [Rhodoglobus sp.]
MTALFARPLRESDHLPVLAAVAEWWGGNANASQLGLLLPRLFFQHFANTSTVLEDESGEMRAFLVGFRSQSEPEVAYIHFVGVDPGYRLGGTGRALYESFFERMRALGCTEVRCITGPPNTTSQAFHAAMGFTASGDSVIDGVLAYPDYDGPGQPRVAFSRAI